MKVPASVHETQPCLQSAYKDTNMNPLRDRAMEKDLSFAFHVALGILRKAATSTYIQQKGS